jgi:salicylate hydroxylase
MTRRPVVVAGGGIAGLSAAIAVARAGREVLVVERDAIPSPEGAGLQLSPNATRHLRDWTVLDHLSASALAPDAVVVRRGRDAGIIARMPVADAQDRWGAPYLVAHRADLLAALLAVASGISHIEIRNARAVVRFDGMETLRVELDDGSSVEAEALIVADGARSHLRQMFESGGETLRHSGRIAWRATIEGTDAPAFARETCSNLWLGAAAHLVHYPLRGGSIVNLVAVIADDNLRGSDGDFWSRESDPWALLARFRDWHADAQDLLRRAGAWRVWPLLQRPMPAALARGSVALAGDAAHPMLPFLAQGAAQAIEDGAALGRAFAGHDGSTAALAAYAQARAGRVARIVAASDRQARVYHLAGPLGAARDLAMRGVGPAGMRRAVDWIYRA